MNYIATVGGKDVPVKVEDLGGSLFRVTIDGVSRDYGAERVQPGVWSLLDGTTAHEVDVWKLPEELEVLIQGDCYKFALVSEQKRALSRAGGKGSAGKAMVSSPMPGKVVRLLVSEGEEVAVDQGVVIVEAMKMENELKSAIAGKVKEIFVKEGEVVESGTKLLLVE